jgi:alanine racemase
VSVAQRWAVAEIDLGAVAHNVEVLRQVVAPADVWAVVKADGYGHSAVPVARTALDAGAAGLCVALVAEALLLRHAGLTAPILLLSEQPPDHAAAIVEHRLTPTVYTATGVDALAAAADAAAPAGRPDPVGVHVKVDTGMQRVGVRLAELAGLLDRIADAPQLRLAGVFTHLAVADDPTSPFTDAQLDRFETALASVAPRIGPGVCTHVANSAGGMLHPRTRSGPVRVGIAMYGLSPGAGVPAELMASLRPVMTLRARISLVKPVTAGTTISYGLRHTFAEDTTVATIPLGYADGVPRRLGTSGGEVLIGGVRCPIVGVVTMDQLMVDCAPALAAGVAVRVGDDVVLIGDQDGPLGTQRITADDVAGLVGTIGYEIVCGISSRVPRVFRPRPVV